MKLCRRGGGLHAMNQVLEQSIESGTLLPHDRLPLGDGLWVRIGLGAQCARLARHNRGLGVAGRVEDGSHEAGIDGRRWCASSMRRSSSDLAPPPLIASRLPDSPCIEEPKCRRRTQKRPQAT